MLTKIINKIEQFTKQENSNDDSTDVAFDLLSNLAESVQEDFEELIGGRWQQQRKVYKGIVKDIVYLLNTNVKKTQIQKIKRIIKIA